ncbi:uncharacterized protein LOC120345891 [Styela clava]
MNISIVFILIYVIAPGWCHDETVFHCRPKPGCKIAQCDSNRVDEYTKEYPITCKSNSTVPNNLNITNIRIGLEKLENKFDDKIERFEKEISENRKARKRIGNQSIRIDNLSRKASKESVEIKGLKKDLVEVKEMNGKLVEDNDNIKKDLIKVQVMNDKLAKDNEQMKKAISRIEQKLVVKDKSHQVQDISKQDTRPTTMTSTTLKSTSKNQTTLTSTPAPENCKLKIGDICYFAVILGKWDVVYNNAVDICKKRNADVGLIRDEESYNAILNYSRENMPEDWVGVGLWIGTWIDSVTGNVTPADSYTEWYADHYPLTGIDYKDRTNIYLVVNKKPNEGFQGMVNATPTRERDGVLCEILM